MTTRSAAGWGRLAAGDWRPDAFRDWLSPVTRKVVKGAMPWNGEAGAKVLVLHECGHGDGIMLVRYAKAMADRGCVVHWQTTEALRGLMRTAPGVATELADLDVGTRVELTAWTRALDLPALLGATPRAVGGARPPYLRPAHASLRSTIGRAFRTGRAQLGICWKGGLTHGYGPNRDLGAEWANRLVARAEADWYSLVPGESLLCAPCAVPAGAPFAETARKIGQLDAVVTTDTAVAHLAGALGCPTLLLLHSPDADWRWVGDWYPSVTQVRQPFPGGGWGSVVDEVARVLRAR